MHATLDSQRVFDVYFDKLNAFLKKVLATFCTSDKLNGFHTCVQPFELIRSTKGHQHLLQKRDLLHI